MQKPLNIQSYKQQLSELMQQMHWVKASPFISIYTISRVSQTSQKRKCPSPSSVSARTTKQTYFRFSLQCIWELWVAQLLRTRWEWKPSGFHCQQMFMPPNALRFWGGRTVTASSLAGQSKQRNWCENCVPLSTRLHPWPTHMPTAQRLATTRAGTQMWLEPEKAQPASWWLDPTDSTSFQLEAQQILALPSYTRKHRNFKCAKDHNEDCVRSQELHSMKPTQSCLCSDHKPQTRLTDFIGIFSQLILHE